MQAQSSGADPSDPISAAARASRTDRIARLVRLLIDDYGFHPGDLVDEQTGEPLGVRALESLVWAAHLEQAHGFSFEDLEGDPTDLAPAELEELHRTVAPTCSWSDRDVTSRHDVSAEPEDRP